MSGLHALVDDAPMSRHQWRVVSIMLALNALDGFDVASISFASPGIAADWGIDRAALGIVLSMELLGMVPGSLSLGRLADRLGRRRIILVCLGIMTAGMLGAASAATVVSLCAWRVMTGLGIGGMLAATNAAAAEAANRKRRALAVSLMAAGLPLGTIVGGSVATVLLARFDWHALFLFGAACSLVLVPVVFAGVPESLAFLAERRPPGALDRVNATLRRMGQPTLAVLPPPPALTGQQRFADLFSPALARATILLTIAYLAHIIAFYFVFKWIPKIVADMGFPITRAATVLVWASAGGAIGALLLGLLSGARRLRALTIAAMLLSTAFVVAFGRSSGSLATLSVLGVLAGFATNAGVVGLYALIAQSFPAGVRATATGFVIGIGRAGAALAPALAGALFAAGLDLARVAILMALGPVIGASALFALPRYRAPDDVAA